MQPVTDQMAEATRRLGEGVAFPGRVRVVCDQRLAGLLPPFLAAQRDWPEATSGAVLAAACGIGWAERDRGGRVLVVVPHAALDDGRFWEAADLAVRLHLHQLVLLLLSDHAEDVTRLQAWGWEAVSDHRTLGHQRPVVHRLAHADAVDEVAAVGLRREWQPVHLPSLPMGGLPPWPLIAGMPAFSAVSGWLEWLAARETHLLVPHLVEPWSALPETPAKALALAQLAGEGRRVIWLLPAGSDLLAFLPALREIGRRGLALKLLCAAGDLPALAHACDLPGWWLPAPADANEAAAVLAHVLDNEDATLVALPEMVLAELPAWPATQAYIPGSARALASGDAMTLICESRTLGETLRARALLHAAGIEAGVLHCTSLIPLPVSALEQAAERAPLLVCAADAIDAGLASLVARVVAGMEGARCASVAGEPQGAPLRAGAVVARARALLALYASG